MRDPKLDPMRGDVFRRGKCIRRVYGLPQLRWMWVSYQTKTDIQRGDIRHLLLKDFLLWAKDAEVVERAEDGL